MSERIYLSPPHMGADERGLLLDAFDSNWIAPLGPHVEAFEQEFAQKIGTRSAAALSSGTAALHLALMMKGVERGDRVLCSTLTFAATANAIAYCGAEPVFIDCDVTSWTLAPSLLEEFLSKSSTAGRGVRAIIVVDLYGQCADYDAINAICEKHGVAVIEDAAEALGATYKGRAAGTLAPVAAFSFNGNKIITTSGGGMLVGDPALTARARYLATQAREPAAHYEHVAIGYNYRMSNLLAAIGRGQLRKIDDRVAERRRIFARYSEALGNCPGVAFMPEAPYGECTRWLTCMTVDETQFGASVDQIARRLEDQNIEARPLWKPMHQQPVFADCEIVGGAVSDHLFAHGLCLPSGSSLTPAQQDRVIEVILESCR